jgi:DNA uptake protein ComE-like DNA-binding protein
VARVAVVVVGIYALRRVDFHRVVDALRRAVPSDTHSTRSGAGEPSAALGPCVDLNSANRADLQRITHIGEDRSRQIMEQRLVRPFVSLADLDRVTGIGPGAIEDIRRQGLACAL